MRDAKVLLPPAEGATICEDAATPARKRLPVRRAILAGIILVLTITAIAFSPVHGWLSDSGEVRRVLDGMGVWAIPMFGLVAAVLTATGVPRLLLCGLAAMLFGFWPGLVLMHIASITGYYAMFLFVRWGGREWVLERWPRLGRLAGAADHRGMIGVILARQLPIHGTLINFCLGLSGISHADFLLGTAIGLIPEAIPAALIGAGIVEANAQDMASYFVTAAIAFALIWLGGAYMVRRFHLSSVSAKVSSNEE